MTSQTTPDDRRRALIKEAATRLAGKSLRAFVQLAWHIVEPQQPYKHNWHHDCITDHLEAVRRGEIKRLVINQPPATTKSLIASVMFNAWVWATEPWQKFLCLSFDQSLSTRDCDRVRGLVESEFFQERWNVEMDPRMNTKTRFQNTQKGWRIGTSFGGRIVGEHPHFKIIDDPHNPKNQLLADSDLVRAREVFDYGLAPRGATLNAATVLIMQRLHEGDLAGHMLAKEHDAVHVCLPMRWEPNRMVETPIGWHDPREGKPGALLWPEEWPEDRVNGTFKPDTWGDAGQFQQRPAPAGGLMFKREWLQILKQMPSDVVAEVRAWDIAGSEEEDAARSAGVRMAMTSSGMFIIRSVVKGRWTEDAVDKVVKQTAQLDGPSIPILEEREPGSAGKAVTRARRRMLVGYDYHEFPPQGDKITRARPMRSQAEGGCLYFLVPEDESGHPDPVAQTAFQEFLSELELFPAGTLKDQVDAAAHALNALTGVSGPLSLLNTLNSPDSNLTQEQAEAREVERQKQAEETVVEKVKNEGVYWPGDDMSGGMGDGMAAPSKYRGVH